MSYYNVLHDLFLGKISTVIAGGQNDIYLSDVEVLNEEKECKVTSLSAATVSPSLFQHKENLLLCGGKNHEKECFQLQNDTWSNFNSLIQKRRSASIVSMRSQSYILGGALSKTTSEVLHHYNNSWQQGPEIPNYGFMNGCGVKLSDDEFLIIGGYDSETRILKLIVHNNTWQEVPIELTFGRDSHRCIVFNKQIIITGGDGLDYHALNSTEIIDFGDGELKMIKGGDLNQKRSAHGMGIINLINDEPTVIAFGGYNDFNDKFLDTVEVWNDTSKTWTLSPKIRLSQTKATFGFATVPTELICP